MKKWLILVITLLIIFIIYYPKIEFYNNDYLYMMSYGIDFTDSEDYYEIEQEMCYDESYSYNKKRNISIMKWEYNNFLFFRWFKIKYKMGNICDSEFLLDESYITRFLTDAVIIQNDDNVDLTSLIKDKKAIVGNIRYPWNDNYKYIEYILDDKYMDMFVSTSLDGLIIIQVGLSDEGPKFIAYK